MTERRWFFSVSFLLLISPKGGSSEGPVGMPSPGILLDVDAWLCHPSLMSPEGRHLCEMIGDLS